MLGNVFETSVSEVWNARPYQLARRLVSNPERIRSEPELAGSFCDGCFVIFDTDIKKTARWANQHRYEEVFTEGPRGRPVRRPREETGLPF